MDQQLFEKLHAEGILSEASLQKIKLAETNKLFSLYWEIKTLLYLAVLLLTGGLGILVYKNIDSIGHSVILIFITIVCAGSFYYGFRNKPAFSTGKAVSPNALFDYLLLLACLTFITLITYLQYQYDFFGYHYGLASFLPMMVLLLSAYYFDNIGILSLAITNLAAWLGFAVTPVAILKENDFNNESIILSGLLLGMLLTVVSIFTRRKNFKKHFEFTYSNFGLHILFISCIAGMFHFSSVYLLWFLLLMGIAFYFYKKAITDKSFYLLLVTALYAYFAVSYVLVKLIAMMSGFNLFPVYITLTYFIGSGVWLVLFLMRINKKFKIK